jgi:hypothetical protein
MFWTDFGEKCIIMHFLEERKIQEKLQRRDTEAQRKDLRKIGDGKSPEGCRRGFFD